VWEEIEPGMEFAFEKRDGRGQDIGAYDYASVMQYGPTAFSRSGRPTIIPHAPNAPIGQRDGRQDRGRSGSFGGSAICRRRPSDFPSAAAPESTSIASRCPSLFPQPQATPGDCAAGQMK
jgi:hypothetical protein